MNFVTHTPASAPAKSQPLLAQAEKAFGFVPNLLGVFAESPAALEAYQALMRIYDKTSLSATERQVVLLTVAIENGCTYCVAAHSTIAGLYKVPVEIVEAVRKGEPLADEKLEALRALTRTVVRERGWVPAEEIQAFLDAGFTKANFLDVITGVTLKTMSNYTNHVAETPVDDAFEAQAWEPVGAAVS